MEAISQQNATLCAATVCGSQGLTSVLCVTAANQSVRNLLKDERLQQQILSIDKSADREKVQSDQAGYKCHMWWHAMLFRWQHAT